MRRASSAETSASTPSRPWPAARAATAWRTAGGTAELEPAPRLGVAGPGVDKRTSSYVAAGCESLDVSNRLAVRIDADLPAGAGLASSAALELALARALRKLHGLGLEDRDLALACHRAESEIVGVRCGVMDQLAAAL